MNTNQAHLNRHQNTQNFRFQNLYYIKKKNTQPKTSNSCQNLPKDRTCFIGGLHIRLKEIEFLIFLKQKYPLLQIEKVKFIPGRKDPSLNRGFGFVILKTFPDYLNLVNSRIFIKEKEICFRPFKQNQKSAPKNNIKKSTKKCRAILKRLPEEIEDAHLAEILTKKNYNFEKCYVIRDSDSLLSKGLGFVDFYNEKELERFLNSEKRLTCLGSSVKIEKWFEKRISILTKNYEEKKCGGKKSSPRDSNCLFRSSSISERVYKFKNKGAAFLKPSLKQLLNENASNYRLNKTFENCKEGMKLL